MRTERQQSEAFTLTELLVVIAVLGILVVLQFPAQALTKQKSKQIGCLRNCKQMALASIAYSDNTMDGAYAYELNAGSDNMNYLYSNYVQNLQVFVCPSTLNVVQAKTAADWMVADWPFGATNLWLKGLRNNSGTRGPSSRHSYEIRGWYSPPGIVGYVKKTYQTVNNFTVTQDHGFPYMAGTKPGPANTFIIHDQDEANSGIPSFRYSKYPDEQDNHGRAGNCVAFTDGHSEFIPENRWIYRHVLSEDQRPNRPPWASPPLVGF